MSKAFDPDDFINDLFAGDKSEVAECEVRPDDGSPVASAASGGGLELSDDFGLSSPWTLKVGCMLGGLPAG
jgi:hypothetical protein